MLYELRHYDVEGERGLRFVVQRFAEHVLQFFDLAKIEPVGFWTTFVGPQSPRLSYLLAWESLAQRQERWGNFEANPDWQRVRNETNREFGGSPIRTIHNTILAPTLSSPLPVRGNQPLRLAGGIFELRQWHFRDYDDLYSTISSSETTLLPLYNRHGIHTMGFWTTMIGISPLLTTMLIYESLSQRESAWAACHTDPDWKDAEETLYRDGRSLVLREESCLMRGTEFSGWR